jgi:hypothetical protein
MEVNIRVYKRRRAGCDRIESRQANRLILPEIFCEFPLSLQANAGIIPRLSHDCFEIIPNSFISHLTIRRYIIRYQHRRKIACRKEKTYLFKKYRTVLNQILWKVD